MNWRSDSTITLYHGTSSRFRRRIQRRGLLPRNHSRNSVYTGALMSPEELVYLSDVYPLHFAKKAVDRFGGNLMLVEVRVDEADLLPDTDFVEGGLGAEKYKTDSARECLRYTGCVCVRGPIPPRALYVIPAKVGPHIDWTLCAIGTYCEAKRARNQNELLWVMNRSNHYIQTEAGWSKNAEDQFLTKILLRTKNLKRRFES